MSDCNHNCSSCSENCSDRKAESLLALPNKDSHIKKIIGVVSGKGGVGKSLVTSMLASTMQKAGYKVGILDADITGPSIPKAFGIKDMLVGDEESMYPSKSAGGVKVVSVNLLLEDETKPVVWRGPVLANAVKQFYSDVKWGEIDYLFVDMPPGTGDVPLTVFQSLPLDGIVIVTTPQDLVSMIVGKAVNMAKMMDINILGLLENMAYIKCPNCEEKIYPFGESKVESVAKEYQINSLGSLPINPITAKYVDQGLIEQLDFEGLGIITDLLQKI